MASKSLRTSFVIGCAAISIAMSQPAFAQQRTFNVPAEDARQSIPEFARQAGIQISAPTARLRGIQTKPIKGNLDTRAALRMLIEGTGLVVASDDGSIIVLRYAGTEQTSSTLPAAPMSEQSLASENIGGGDIVVTGSRLRALGDEGATPVTTFDQKRIQQLGADSIAGVLDYLPQQTFSFSDFV